MCFRAVSHDIGSRSGSWTLHGGHEPITSSTWLKNVSLIVCLCVYGMIFIYLFILGGGGGEGGGGGFGPTFPTIYIVQIENTNYAIFHTDEVHTSYVCMY